MQTLCLNRIPAKLVGCFLFFALTHWTQPVRAAMEFVCVEPPEGKTEACLSIFLRGRIEKGDYERFLSFYRPLHRTVRKLYLQSPGGDPEEAMKLGRLLRKYLVVVEAPNGGGGEDGATQMLFSPTLDLCEGPACICASACALVWLSSVERWGSVGLHRPRITDPQFVTLPLGEARTAYNKGSAADHSISRRDGSAATTDGYHGGYWHRQYALGLRLRELLQPSAPAYFC
jgi:hypothetical protein